jgi:hypothetical protein
MDRTVPCRRSAGLPRGTSTPAGPTTFAWRAGGRPAAGSGARRDRGCSGFESLERETQRSPAQFVSIFTKVSARVRNNSYCHDRILQSIFHRRSIFSSAGSTPRFATSSSAVLQSNMCSPFRPCLKLQKFLQNKHSSISVCI